MDRLRALAETTGSFTRADALDCGYDDKAIARAVKAGRWTRIRAGAYTFRDLWSHADELARHRATARAVMKRLGPSVALSHISAVIDHGLPAWSADLSLVHVTRLDGGAGRTEAGVVHHEGLCLKEDVMERDGYLVMKPARAALEAGAQLTAEAAIALFDAGLHAGRFARGELEAGFCLMQSWPGFRKLQIPVRFADGRAESVGESRCRYLCHVHGLPAPELQFTVRDRDGRVIGVTDLAWPEHALLGEFDGKVKYGRLLKPGEDPGDAVFREKRREDQLRERLMWSMVRIVWADLYRGAETAARIRRLMRVAA
ncbi:MAG TPA: type IV toxin-antitoxin system AbiEi family antitoxin domain-containing protein [Nocardioidaceae bacterium]|nr:type IV toxin-antitoxin system AbiEi family antitoxin domain-containing protein [Nocardioidaceae bacterium]